MESNRAMLERKLAKRCHGMERNNLQVKRFWKTGLFAQLFLAYKYQKKEKKPFPSVVFQQEWKNRAKRNIPPVFFLFLSPSTFISFSSNLILASIFGALHFSAWHPQNSRVLWSLNIIPLFLSWLGH